MSVMAVVVGLGACASPSAGTPCDGTTLEDGDMVCHAGRWANARPFVRRAFEAMAEIEGLCRSARDEVVFRGKRLEPDEPQRRFGRAVARNPMLHVAVEAARAWSIAHEQEGANDWRSVPAASLNPCHVALGAKILSIAGERAGIDDATLEAEAAKQFASMAARPGRLAAAIERGDMITVRSLVEAEPELVVLDLIVRGSHPMKPRALAILAGRREIVDYLTKMAPKDR